MPKIEWTLVKSKVNDLKEYHINPRQMTKKGLADLKKSITKFGVAEPLVVNQDMTICGGHGRKIVLQEMGIKEVDCYIPNRLLNEKEFQELNIRLNKNIAGEWDFDILANNFDMTEIKDWGFTDFDLKIDVLEDKDKLSGGDKSEDIVDLTNQTAEFIQFGDIVELKKHRLMCGDSFSNELIDILINGQKIDAIYTDPPYGMNLNTDFSIMAMASPKTGYRDGIIGKKYKKVLNDDKPFDPTFIFDKFNNVAEIFLWGANYYADKLPDLAMGKSSWIVWDKRVELDSEGKIKRDLADVDYTLSEFELCWSKTKHRQRIIRCLWFGFNGNQYEGLETLKNKGSLKRCHPNQKPVRMINEFFKLFLENQINILDLFGGSGSTLIACEQSNKTCFMMEYDPVYVETIIKRYIKIYDDNDIFITRDGIRKPLQDYIKK